MYTNMSIWDICANATYSLGLDSFTDRLTPVMFYNLFMLENPPMCLNENECVATKGATSCSSFEAAFSIYSDCLM